MELKCFLILEVYFASPEESSVSLGPYRCRRMEPSCFLILSAKDMLLRKDRTSQPPSLWKQYNEIPCSILCILIMDDARVGSDGCKIVSDTTTS